MAAPGDASPAGLLVAFSWTFVFQVIAGRSLHAPGGEEGRIGARLGAPVDLTWAEFVEDQPDFAAFLAANYRPRDTRSPAALLYARWTYARFMAPSRGSPTWTACAASSPAAWPAGSPSSSG